MSQEERGPCSFTYWCIRVKKLFASRRNRWPNDCAEIVALRSRGEVMSRRLVLLDYKCRLFPCSSIREVDKGTPSQEERGLCPLFSLMQGRNTPHLGKIGRRVFSEISRPWWHCTSCLPQISFSLRLAIGFSFPPISGWWHYFLTVGSCLSGAAFGRNAVTWICPIDVLSHP